MKFLILLAIMPFMVCAQTVTTVAPRVVPATQFVVVAPFRIQPGKPFNVLITRSGVIKAITVTTTITSSSPSFTPIVRSTRISTLISRAFISFDTTAIPPGNYFLQVDGEGYSEKRALTYATKDSAILIQLNKALFSPEQIIQGRIFAIDADTNAVTPKQACSVKIHDPAGNILANYSPYFNNGRWAFTMKLSDQPPIGRWNVNVTCGKEITTKSFDVEETKLPAYELIVTVPSINSLSQSNIPVVITAEYTFGKPANGVGTFVIEESNMQILTRTVTLVNGRESFDIDINFLYEGNFVYTFNMKDSTLESSETVEGGFQIVDSSYRLEIVGSNLISPGSPYNFTVVMRKFDGSPAPAGSPISVTISPLGSSQTVSLRSDGTAAVLINIPSGYSFIEIRATATQAQSGYLRANSLAAGSFIDLYAGLNRRKLGEQVQIIVTVSDDIEFVNYVIASKGAVLASDQVTFSVGKRQTSIWFRPDFKYAASCQVIAYYVNKNGDIVTGRTNFEFRDKLTNFVKLSFDEANVAPGYYYPFNVQSQCDSTVSLTAIDQRSLLLRQGNNILKEDVFESLSRYETVDGIIKENRPYYEYESQFNTVGVLTFTNIPPNPQSQSPPSVYGSFDGPLLGAVAVRVRKDFSETFCWNDVTTSSYSNCSATVTCRVPESLTSYFVYSVAMNAKYGLGLTETPSTITTNLPFFMVVDLPYSIYRNEILVLDIVFFNSITQDQYVDIAVTKSAQFTGVNTTTYGWQETSIEYTKTYLAKASTNFKVQFALKSNFLGIFNIKVTAKGPLAGDGLEKPLRVIPKGIQRSITSTNLFVLDQIKSASTSLQCVYPPGVYADTQDVLASVIGDLLGTAFNNLDKLIYLPTGCLEQKLSTFAVTLAIHDYLKTTQKLTSDIEKKLYASEAVGIINALAMLRSDGGFSFFASGSSSTWLTAYVIKALFDARVYEHGLNIDEEVLRSGVEFILSKQQSDGRFIESAPVYSTMQSGGYGGGIAMTAYISVVLMHMMTIFPDYRYAEKTFLALDYLAANVASLTNVYELGVVSYALILAGYEAEAENGFNRFFAMRFESPTTIEWTVNTRPAGYYIHYSSLDVEISSYGLKLLLEYGKNAEAVKVAKFLVSQTNQYGGFKSSHDTVVGLEALSLFARIIDLNHNVQLTLTPNIGSSISATINDYNFLTLQQFALNQNVTQLGVAASTTTSGLAVVSLTCNFYQDPAQITSSFAITYQFTKKCQSSIKFTVCARYTPTGASKMALIQVRMPSGFRYSDTTNSVTVVKKTEVTDDRSLVTFYLQSIGNVNSCVELSAYRYTYVYQLEGGYTVVNDYYDTTKEGFAYYQVNDLTLGC